MTAEKLLQHTVWLEPTLLACLLLALAAFLIRTHYFKRTELHLYSPTTPFQRLEQSITSRQEIVFLSGILAFAILLRTIGWNQAWNSPHWFSQAMPLVVADLWEGSTFGEYWVSLLTRYAFSVPYQSAVMLPVAALFQKVLGPSIHLPVLVGAFWSVLGIVAAWGLGRLTHSKTFGLLFAAAITVTPLNLVWSRTGGIVIGGPTHVLLVLWVSYAAGFYRSKKLAVLSGILIWLTAYQYMAARVAFPLGFLALLAGWLRSRTEFRQGCQMLLVVLGTLGAIYILSGTPEIRSVVYPSYGGYTGNRGEKTLVELFEKNWPPISIQFERSVDNYFFRDRAVLWDSDDPLQWGMRYGGLTLAPFVALGAIGVFVCGFRWKRRFLWFFLAAAGFALPCLSIATARRFIIFDVAWCALVAFGVVFVLGRRSFGIIDLSWIKGGLAVLTVGIGLWSFASIVLLNATLTEGVQQPIPYGEAGFADGITCLRCLKAGYAWQKNISHDEFIVLFDSDLERENRTAPGGLPLYGKLAALAAGKPHHFLSFYAVMKNYDSDPPNIGHLYDINANKFSPYLSRRIEQARPKMIRWHFEFPTQWERWLISQLQLAGGEVQFFSTALSPNPGVQVLTRWENRREVFAVFEKLEQDPLLPAGSQCVYSTQKTPLHQRFTLALTGTPPAVPSQTPDWVLGSWGEAFYQGKVFDKGKLADIELVLSPTDSSLGLYLLRRRDWHEAKTDALPAMIGLDCGVNWEGHWWVVNALSGTITTTHPQGNWLPQKGWVGAALDQQGNLFLASARQALYHFDMKQRKLISQFPARVPPSNRVFAGECTPVLMGNDWVATADPNSGQMNMYGLEGSPIAYPNFKRLAGLGDIDVFGIGNAGNYLGIGLGESALSVKMEIRENCLGPQMVHLSMIDQPRKKGTIWNDFSNMILTSEGIYIDMGGVNHLPFLELSLDNNDEYTLRYFKEGEALAEQTIPGMRPPRSGLRVYRLSVPEAVTIQGFDTLHVRPIRGDGAYSLGHVRLLSE